MPVFFYFPQHILISDSIHQTYLLHSSPCQHFNFQKLVICLRQRPSLRCVYCRVESRVSTDVTLHAEIIENISNILHLRFNNFPPNQARKYTQTRTYIKFHSRATGNSRSGIPGNRASSNSRREFPGISR